MSIEKTAFGAAEKYTIRGNGQLDVSILTYGATLQSICYKGTDVCLGYNDLEGYQTMTGYLGATVGRYANRIAGGKFTLNGKTYDVGCNEAGRGHLHGGKIGLDKKIWRAETLGGNALKMTTSLADGEEGYPGNMQISVTFTVEGNDLRIAYEATADADTVFNPTNHCYFNLNGQDGAPTTNHILQINASAYTPVDELLIPTGEIRPVQGTPFDFTVPKPIGRDIAAEDPQIQLAGGFDHNFVLPGEGLRQAAVAVSPVTGIQMECYTDMPAVQYYSGCCLDNPVGKSGAMGQFQGFCLETQTYPDAPNHPSFPSATLKAGEIFRSVTEYRFSK
ncbi:MAG: galactose mutarotase [Clostridia bacterium]|nr:galactose mutarotase [Clostridia bacterium]